jgi:hypothetical protein
MSEEADHLDSLQKKKKSGGKYQLCIISQPTVPSIVTVGSQNENICW